MSFFKYLILATWLFALCSESLRVDSLFEPGRSCGIENEIQTLKKEPKAATVATGTTGCRLKSYTVRSHVVPGKYQNCSHAFSS